MSDLLDRLPLVFVRRCGQFHDLATCGGGDEVLVAISRQPAARKGTVAVNRDVYLQALAAGVKYIYLHSTATGHRLFMSIMDLPSSANIWRSEGYQVVTLPEWHRHEGFAPSVELDQELLKSDPEERPKHPMHPLAAAHQPVANDAARSRRVQFGQTYRPPFGAAQAKPVRTYTFDRQRDLCQSLGIIKGDSTTVKLTTLLEHAHQTNAVIVIDGNTNAITVR